MTLITFTVLPFLAVASVVLFPIVNDRIDDPVGISVRHATQVASSQYITSAQFWDLCLPALAANL